MKLQRLSLLLFATLVTTPAFAKPKAPPVPQMEVAFVLDTTGSMSSLIAGAKKKIWSIVNEIVTAKPQPKIKIGFVVYRDKGDAYVTQVHQLTEDLDGAFTTLGTFKADGGGDTPEHVNAGLHDAVTKLEWSAGGSENRNLYRVIFLVGDCPPHMDYDDGLDYKTDVDNAAARGIFVNAIRCGNNSQTEKVWTDIAMRGHGNFLTLAQSGGTTDTETPFDAEMIRLGAELEHTTVARRGTEGMQAASAAMAGDFASTRGDRENAISRASFAAKSSQIYSKFDLTTEVANGRRVADIKKDELPNELQKMSVKERTKFFEQKVADRKRIQARLIELDNKRFEYAKQELAKNGGKDSFDQQMLGTFKGQASMGGAAPPSAGNSGSAGAARAGRGGASGGFGGGFGGGGFVFGR